MLRTKNSHLTDEEFIKLVESKQDPMTSTDIEIELLDRFKRLADLETFAFLKVLERTGLSFDDALNLLSCLSEYSIDSCDHLTAALAVHEKLNDLTYYENTLDEQLTQLLKIIQPK